MYQYRGRDGEGKWLGDPKSKLDKVSGAELQQRKGAQGAACCGEHLLMGTVPSREKKVTGKGINRSEGK